MRMPLEGGVYKRHPGSPARTAFKSTLAKGGPLKADSIVAQLKSLLPNAKHEKETSEVNDIAVTDWICLSSSYAHTCTPIAVLTLLFHTPIPLFLSSQRDLVEETISYIAYLEGILQMANEKVNIV